MWRVMWDDDFRQSKNDNYFNSLQMFGAMGIFLGAIWLFASMKEWEG